MGFSEAITAGFQRYATFSGRATRSEYWFWALFTILGTIVTAVIDNVVLSGFALSNTIFSLAVLIPSFAVGARRLHDIDRTGWWLLIGLTGIGAIVLLVFFVLEGTRGANRYGADPIDLAAGRPPGFIPPQ